MDFTPLGAYRLFGGAVPGLAARMVDIEDVLGHDGRRLRERLGETKSWERRMDLVEKFVTKRTHHEPSPEIAYAWRELTRSGGTGRIACLATEIGWSRKHFARRFTAEIGLAPKTVARMIRFHNACRIACNGRTGWAQIAAEAGYADQAHLVREFGELAGEPPAAWAGRVAKLPRDVVARMSYLQDG
jgi:AraC-like DNA-binding protein